MRRLLAAALVLCLLCTTALAVGLLTDGQYSGSAQGRNGPIEADVTVQYGCVASVDVSAYAETPSKLQLAMQIVEKIVGCGSYTEIEAVDTISGATMSSQGIKNAVLDALKDAKPDWAHEENDPCPSARFTDMPPFGNWGHQPIDWAVANGITNGVSDTAFAPSKGCTRAQIVTFLWRMAGAPVEYGALNLPFSDVGRMQYYTQAVHWAVTNGIVMGVDETHFAPDQTCTHAQAVTFLWRMAGKPEGKGSGIRDQGSGDVADGSPVQSPCSDVKDSDYFYNAVLWAVENGITEGTGNGLFRPNRTCTRVQIVTFLFRARTILPTGE